MRVILYFSEFPRIILNFKICLEWSSSGKRLRDADLHAENLLGIAYRNSCNRLGRSGQRELSFEVIERGSYKMISQAG